jgi:splicing factor 3B subunit 3
MYTNAWEERVHQCSRKLQMIVYGTISGAIGVLLPFHSSKDLDVFSHIEMHLRQLAPSLVGRDHLAFRGSFFPVKDVVDGDLCEQFVTLTSEKQRVVCEETDKTIGEVLKRLEEMRNMIV